MRTEVRNQTPGSAARFWDLSSWRYFGLSAVVACLFAINTLGANHNILLVIADDFGFDNLALYNTNSAASFAPTPNVNSLASRGVRFVNAYGYPTCSPSRSAMITGR